MPMLENRFAKLCHANVLFTSRWINLLLCNDVNHDVRKLTVVIVHSYAGYVLVIAVEFDGKALGGRLSYFWVPCGIPGTSSQVHFTFRHTPTMSSLSSERTVYALRP